jgi:T1SS-143 domain-containing protein
MTTVATVISVSGLVWVQNASGEQRLLAPGDQMQPGESLVTTATTRVVLDFGGQRPIAFVGAEPGTEEVAQIADIPVILLPAPAAGEETVSGTEEGGRSAPMAEGHGFVQLVKIAEILESDGITPLTVAAIKEVLNPLAMDWPEPSEELDEERYNRGGDDGMVFVDNTAPGVNIELLGVGPDGIYSQDDIGPDGTVTAKVTLEPGTEVGDKLVITDKDGNVLLERPVTEDDLTNGIKVEVPVQPGDKDVTVNATITDTSGNRDDDSDTKPIDNVPPSVSVELTGTGDDGVYNEDEIGEDGTVTAEVTLNPGTDVGDNLTVTDKDGNELLNRPVTQDDLNNGVSVEVPVQPGDSEVTVNASVTDPAGNSASASDNKPIDWLVDIDVPTDQDATTPDADTADQVVFESGLIDGSNPSEPNTKVDSSFTLTVHDGLAESGALVLGYTDTNGDPQTLTLSKAEVEALGTTSQTINTQYGDLVLKGYTQNADGTLTLDYEYTLTDAPDVDGTDTLDHISITATDADGDSDTQGLSIKIVDDAPVAEDDRNEITEDTVSVSGNVRDDAGAGSGDVADTQGADGATVTHITSHNEPGNTSTDVGSGVLTIEGEYGTLTIHPDGSYTYALDNNPEVNALKDGETLDEVFTYTLTDGDGDTSSADLTITINGVTDGAPSIVPVDENGTGVAGAITVSESGLASGTNAASDDESASGTITITAQDGLASINIAGQDFDLAALQALSPTSSATIPVEGGTLELTGFTSTTTVGGVPTAGELSYTYTLTGERDHNGTEDDALTLDISMSVTVAAGGTGNGTLQVQVVDDTPIAEADTDSVTEGATLSVDAASGVLSNDTSGADGWANSGSAVVGVAKGNTGSVLDDNSTLGTAIAGDYGTLTLHADGSYTYVSTANAVSAYATDVFTYTVKDADGDLTQTTLTINVNDVTGTPENTVASVDEAGLPAGTDSASDSNKITDGSLNLQIGWSVGTDQSGNTGKGSWSVGTDGKFTYELTSSTTEGSGDIDSFTYTAVDQYGNEVENTVTITIVDDQPQVTVNTTEPGSLTVDETTLGTADTNSDFVTGVFNFAYGADGKDTTVYSLKVTDGTASGVIDTETGESVYLYLESGQVVGRVGNSGSADESGETAFVITVDPDSGAATLTQSRPLKHSDTSNHDDPLSLTDGAIQLVATVTDGDGDTDSASVDVGNNFVFRDDGPVVSGQPSVTTVDEKYLDSGSEAGNGTTSVNADLPVDAGEDGMGSLTFSETQTELQTMLNSTGNSGVSIAVNDNVLTGTRGGEDVFVVTLDKSTGQYTFELKEALVHPASYNGSFDLEFAYQVEDADGDTAPGTFKVKVVDDVPKTSVSITTDEDTPYGPFTTSADSTQDNVSIQDASDNAATPVTEYPDGSSIPSELKGYDVGHGVVVVDADGKLTYYPDADYSNEGSTDNFQVTITNDDGTTTETEVDVTVNPISDAPTLAVDAENTSTQEDTAVELGLNAPVIVDDTDQNGATAGDDPERLGEITLSGLPEGAVLTYGSNTYNVTSSGSVTIQLSDLGSGDHLSGLTTDLTMSTSDFESMTVTPPAHSHENFTVEMSVTSYEVDASGKQLSGVAGATSTTEVNVRVQAVTDDAELVFDTTATSIDDTDSVVYTGNTEADVTLKEDTTFDLTDMLSASFEDLDGSEVRSITITNPTGNGTITVNGDSVAAGESFTIDDLAGASGQTGGIDSFPEIQIGGAGDFSGDLNGITVTINAQDVDDDGWGDGASAEHEGENGVVEADTSNNSVTLNLHVTPVAGDVTAGDVETTEDTAVNFLENVRVTDTGTGNEVIDKVVFEVPTGWEVGQSTVSNGATWTANLSGSTYTIEFIGGSEAEREAVLDGFTITPPAHSSADADIELTITTTDTNTTGTDTQVTTETVKVEVTPVGEVIDGTSDDSDPDDLSMVGDHTYSSAGEEDEWFTLGKDNSFDLSVGWSNEDSDGSEQTFALLTPQLVEGDGSQTDANGSQFRYDNGSGWITQTYGGEAIEVPVEYLDTLQFLAPPDFSGKFDIKVEALTRDTDPDDGSVNEQISGESTLSNILIKPVADEVTTTVTARVQGNEDESMPLSIRPSSSDPSETFDVTIDAIPDGATIVYDGQTLSAGASGLPAGMTITNNGDGTWKVEIENFDPAKGAGMTLTPPEHSNDPFTLSVSTVSVDTLTVNGTDYESESDPFVLSINVTPKGVADEANVEVVDPSAQNFVEADVDSAGGVMLTELLNGTPSLIDNDGSETLSFKLSNLPGGFGVEGATSLGNGQWVFAASDLSSVKITTPTNFSGTSAAFTLAAVTTENDGDSLTAEHSVQIRITPSPEATMNLSTAGVEDIPVKLDFSAQQQNGETGETITEVWIKASDLSGQKFTLTYGENGSALADGQSGVSLEGGWYKLNSTAMDNIYLKGDDNWHGDGSFTVRYEVTDPGDDATVAAVSEMSGEETYNVSVAPVTDQPALSVTAGGTTSLTAPGTASIDLEITNNGVNGGDYDGSEQLIRILLDNVPEGVIVEGADFIGGNQWLFITDDSFGSALTPSINLKVQSEAGGLTDHEISITVITKDADNGKEEPASTTVKLTTNFPDGEGSQLPAEIEVWEQADFDPTEDTAFTLSEAFTGTIDDEGVTNNGFNITLSNLPEGTVVTGMTATVIDGQTVWTASGTGGNAELQKLMNNIAVTPPADWNRHDGDFVFDAKLTTYVPSGLRNEKEVGAKFEDVQPVSDEPEISISAPAVDEGSDLTFTVDLSNAADDPNWTLVGDKLYLQLDESGIFGNGVLKQGGTALSTSSVSGVAGVPDGSYYVINGADPASSIELTYTASGEHVSGSVSLTAWAQSQETGSSAVETSSVTQSGVINPVNSGYDFTVTDVSGTENASQLAKDDKSNVIKLDVTNVGLNDEDGSESIGTVLLSDVPNGFLVYVGTDASNATLADLSNNAGGDGTTNTWLLGEGGIPAYIGIMPPQYWSGTVSGLKLQVTSSEDVLSAEEVSTETFNLTVEAKADGLTLAPTPSFGEEGDIIPLNLNHELKDPYAIGPETGDYQDGSTETLTLEFSGMGENAAFYLDDTLISGTAQVTDNGGGSYTISGLTTEEAETLGFVQAADALNNVQVRARTVESSNDDTSTWTEWKGIDTSGVTAQYGTTGNDSLLWTGEAIDAFGGDDVIQLRFDESVDGSVLGSKLSNIEEIDMTGMGDNSITSLTAQDVLDMTDSGNKLTISGDADDSVTLDSGSNWIEGSSASGYTTYTATVGTDTTVTLEVQNTLID